MLEPIKEDLARSGLTMQDLNARPATSAEFANCNYHRTDAVGYAIPYYSITGAPLPFYRVKLVGPTAPGNGTYRQPANTQNYLYFPPAFLSTLERHVEGRHARGQQAYIIITEGEKKAALACKLGFPTAAVSGVDSWRNRTFILPADAEAYQATDSEGQQRLKVKLTSASMEEMLEQGGTAQGFNQLVDLALNNNLCILICYDSDPIAATSLLETIAERHAAAGYNLTEEQDATDKLGPISVEEIDEAEMNPAILQETHLKFEVQRAAAALGYELRSRGIPTHRIRQLVLPLPRIDEVNATLEVKKVGLDDFLMANGPDDLEILISENLAKRVAFPRHPAIRSYVVSQLQRNVGRKQLMSLALAIITEMDARGRRLLDADTKVPYYFDDEQHKLFTVRLESKEPIHETPFGQFLYHAFGISAADNRILSWIASLFTGEQPIEYVTPSRVVTFVKLPDDPRSAAPNIAYQISDSEYVIVTPNRAKPIEIVYNGTYGVLFEPGHVVPIRKQELIKEFYAQFKNGAAPFEPWWLDVLRTLNVKNPDGVEAEASVKQFALLHYISPWLLRWRGMQLPVEFAIGEAGSGKSSLCALRLSVLTGNASLRNQPRDIRDFYSGIVACGGVYAIDNAKFTDKNIQQALSDDMCRITTEPKPHVELRKLYTTSDLFKAPIRATFLWTAIEMPFRTVDLIQRSAVLHVKGVVGAKDGDWVPRMLDNYGGRVGWVAHQLLFLHKFLVRAKTAWNPDYRASHRLAHYEQALVIAAEVCGMETGWIKGILKASMEKVLEDGDWAMDGIREFADMMRQAYPGGTQFPVASLVNWAVTQEDYARCTILVNPRLLGRYMQAHAQTIEQIAGIKEAGTYGNRRVYRIMPPTQAQLAELRRQEEEYNSEVTKH